MRIVESFLYLCNHVGVVLGVHAGGGRIRCPQNGDAHAILFDPDLGALPHLAEKSGKIANRIGFRDVKGGHGESVTPLATELPE